MVAFAIAMYDNTFKTFRMWISTTLGLVFVWQVTVGTPTGTLEPTVSNAVKGGTAVFTCTVTGRDKVNEFLLWTANDKTDDTNTRNWNFLANLTRTFDIHNFSPWVHGNYFMTYNIGEQDAEILQLRITNVTSADGYFKFNCLYGNIREEWRSVLSSSWAEIIVWTIPTTLPHCSVQGYIPPVITRDRVHAITLICSLNDGDPIPNLSWYRVTDDGHEMEIGKRAIHSNSINQQITADDHGREYICKAHIAATPDDPITCSVIPYNPVPEVSLIPDTLLIESGDSISLVCNNTGTTTSNTTYYWYIDNIWISSTNDGSVAITQMETKSALTIKDSSSLLSDNSKITCEAVIPMVAQANVSLSVTVVDTPQTFPATTDAIGTQTTSNKKSSPNMLVIIVAAAAGGCFVVIILVLIYCARRKYAGSNEDKEQAKEMPTSVVQSSEEMKGSNQKPERIRTENGNATPVYAFPNKETTDSEGEPSPSSNVPQNGVSNKGEPQVSSDTPIYALSTKSKRRQKGSQQYDDIHSSLYDDVSIENTNDISEHSDSKKSKNVEGLTYADLELSPLTRTNNADSNEHILGQDNFTVYSEVRM